MNCPACGKALVEHPAGALAVDACMNGCGGLWFDQAELRKVDEPHEAEGETLLAVAGSGAAIDRDAKRPCPRCPDIVMMKHFFSVKHETEIDECGNCGGIWLDVGELRAIRKAFPSETERIKAAHAYFDDVFGPQLNEQAERSRLTLDKRRRVANLFRYLCPSSYIPGKQSWGAF